MSFFPQVDDALTRESFSSVVRAFAFASLSSARDADRMMRAARLGSVDFFLRSACWKARVLASYSCNHPYRKTYQRSIALLLCSLCGSDQLCKYCRTFHRELSQLR